jgi:hypothetical protein
MPSKDEKGVGGKKIKAIFMHPSEIYMMNFVNRARFS